MALLYADSFGQYEITTHVEAASELIGAFWSVQEGNWAVEALETGRNTIRLAAGGSNPSYLSGAIPDNPTTIVVGFRFNYASSYGAAGQNIMNFKTSGDFMGGIYFDGITGKMSYVAYGSYASFYTRLASNGATGLGETDYWEFKIIFGNSTAGSIYIYKNGVLDSSVTGIDTIYEGSVLNTLQLATPAAVDGGQFLFSDFYVDTANQHGDMKVTYEPCDSSGAASDWTPLASTNQSQIDEYEPDDETTYNRSTVATDKDSLTPSPTIQMGDVKGIVAVARVRKEDANDSAIKLGVLHSGTEEQSGDLPVTTSYQYIHYVQEDVPGGSGWSEAQSDVAEISIEHVAI